MRRRFTAKDRKRLVDEVRAGAAVKDVPARMGLNPSMGTGGTRGREAGRAEIFFEAAICGYPGRRSWVDAPARHL
jgi:hypothetical protein